MKRHSRISTLLIVAALWCGAAHAQNAPAEERDEVTFRPWIGTLGVHFQSEHLFQAPARAPFPGAHGSGQELSSQTNTAGLHGLGLGGVWRPFRNGFQLNFAMYLDPVESGVPEDFRSRTLSDLGFPADDLVTFSRDFEAVSYVGLGWKTNGAGLGVNLDVGALLSEEYSLRDDACLGSASTPSECGAASFGSGRGKLPGSFRGFEWYPVVSLGIEYRF
jgi:hypothetical protein